MVSLGDIMRQEEKEEEGEEEQNEKAKRKGREENGERRDKKKERDGMEQERKPSEQKDCSHLKLACFASLSTPGRIPHLPTRRNLI